MSKSNLAYKKAEITTDAEYLEFERAAKRKHEFIGGEIAAMAGASERHNIIASNLFLGLGLQARKNSCRTFASDMRVKAKQGNYYYPDIVISCGERNFEDGKRDVLLNPKVVVEMLSKSTKLKDRNEKFDSYTVLETITDYILIEQDETRVEHYTRAEGEDWRLRVLREPEEILNLASINCQISLAEIYNEVEFGRRNASK
ncbi:MAG: Uma2 family endonuclease [Pyrinomonadaceae bacterium]